MTTTLSLAKSGLAIELHIATDQPNTTPMTAWIRYGNEPNRIVRGMDGFTGYPASFVVLDYEIPYGTTLTYSVQCGPDYAEASIASPAETSAWLRDVMYPDDSVRLVITSNPVAKTTSRAALLTPIGRANVVAVTDVRSGRSGTAVLTTLTEADAIAMRRLFATGDVLLLTGPASWRIGPIYWLAQGVEERRVGLATSPVLQWAVEWVQVDPPVALLLRTPSTYAAAKTKYVTYVEMRKNVYSTVLYPPAAVRGAPTARRWRA